MGSGEEERGNVVESVNLFTAHCLELPQCNSLVLLTIEIKKISSTKK
jgi:hypothetical protein